MQYSDAHETETIVEKAGAAWVRRISCGDTHFKGAFGGR